MEIVDLRGQVATGQTVLDEIEYGRRLYSEALLDHHSC